MIDTREYISNLNMPEKVTLFKELYNELAGHGIEGDTELAHVNTFEASLLKSLGGSGTINEITNLREYKGGGSAPPPPPSTQTVTQTSEFPTELKPFVKDILGEARGEFGREQAEGFQAFPGPQLAAFTPEQQAAFAAGRQQFTGLAGTPLGRAATYYTPALAATALGTAEVGPEDIQRRMDPFLQNVVDIAKRESEEDEERARQQRAAKAVAGQGFLGGTRIPLVVEEQARQAQAQRLGDIQARGSSIAFQNALRAAEQQRQRELTGGRQFAALGDVTGARAREDIRGLAGTGEVQQARSQQALDIARREFEEEKAFPQTALQRYASIIRGFPLTPSQTTLATRREAPPSLAQSLTTAGLGAAGIYGMFGGFNPTQPVASATGGLVSLQGGGQPAMNINMGTGGGYASSVPAMSTPQGGLSVDVLLEELARRGINRSNGGLMSVVRRAAGDPLTITEGGGGRRLPDYLRNGALPGFSTYDLTPAQIQELMLGDLLIEPIPAPTFTGDEEPPVFDRFSELKSKQKALEDAYESQAVRRQEAIDLYKELPSEEERRKELEKYYTERRGRLEERTGYGKGQALLAAAAGVAGADPAKGYLAALGAGAREGLGTYGPIAERAYEGEEAIAAQERGEVRGLPLDTLAQRVEQLKLEAMETTDKKELFNLQASIKTLEIEQEKVNAEWLANYGIHAAVMPAPSEVYSGFMRGEYGDIETPGNVKNADELMRTVYDRVYRKLEERARAGIAVPGEAGIQTMFYREFDLMIAEDPTLVKYKPGKEGKNNKPVEEVLSESDLDEIMGQRKNKWH